MSTSDLAIVAAVVFLWGTLSARLVGGLVVNVARRRGWAESDFTRPGRGRGKGGRDQCEPVVLTGYLLDRQYSPAG